MVSYGLVDADYAIRLQRMPDKSDGPVYMLSLARFRRDSGQIRGRSSGPDPVSHYIPIPLLSAVGARLCFVANALASSGDWDRVGVVRYPTRRAFLELAGRSDARELDVGKQHVTERAILLGMISGGALPVAHSQRVLVEVWDGPAPAPIAAGTATQFDVEGTYIGDGRQWSGARFTAIDPGTALPLEPVRSGYLAVLVAPVVQRWN